MNIVQRKRFFGNLTLAIISLILILLFAELLLRKIIPVDTGTSFMYRIPHPVFGWILEPGATYSNRMPEATVRVAYNTKGYRDVEHTVQNTNGVFRSLVLGDSFMEAYSVELNDAFHRRVEEFARGMGSDIEVINLGVGGYGTLQEYLVFREVGQAYAPDLVLLGVYIANDVRNNSIELESLVNTGTMKVESRPFLDPIDSTDWRITQVDFEGAKRRYAAAKARHNTFLKKVAGQSVLLQLSARAWWQIRRMISAEIWRPTHVELDTNVDNRQLKNFGLYGVNYCTEPSEYTRAWGYTKRILARLQRDTEAMGSRLVVFSVPALHDASVPYMEEVRRKLPNPDRFCFEKAPAYGRLRRILKELRIDYIDILPDFRKAMQEGIPLFRLSDRHWNSAGHALAAQLVVSALIEEQLLPLKQAATVQQSANYAD